ncbi:MAG: glycoside hydrolase family 127 protein [Acidimicrobiales bacterium]
MTPAPAVLGGPIEPRSSLHSVLRPLPGRAVRLQGGFWGERQQLNREVTIPHGIEMLEEWGSLDNLRVAAGESRKDYHLPLFTDSDVYKLLEAIAWDRQHGPCTGLEVFYERTARLLAAAQSPDGYLNSFVQAGAAKRFGDPAMGHELYCAGHLFQAAVAESRSGPGSGRTGGGGTGQGQDQPLGNVASRFAAYLLDALAAMPSFVPGHPEVEMALVETYRQSGTEALLDLAANLVGRRGQSSLHFGSFGPEYFQDDIEVAKAETIRGHAVRALYLLSGVADLYMETGRPELLRSCADQWEDMVTAKTYLTGGVGSRHEDEAFGEAYELPPDRAYCETCAAIASIMWNWRMCLITGEARFAELVERTLYNGFLAGWGLDGQSFFYVNPLQSRGSVERKPWYRCACCPPNVMRLMASLEHLVATGAPDGVQLHQFVPATIAVQMAGGPFRAKLDTPYPYEGWLTLQVDQAPAEATAVAIRAPSWAPELTVEVNGAAHSEGPGPDGYVRVRRQWQGGDEVSISFPLRPRVLRPDPRVEAVRGCAALERGPLVYCFEAPDRAGAALGDIAEVDVSGGVGEKRAQIGSEKLVELTVAGRSLSTQASRRWPYYDEGPARPDEGTDVVLSAVPYYAWANRGPSRMRIWAPEARP